MNEVTKERIAEKMVQVLEKTNLKHVQVALRLGIEVVGYISMIKRSDQHKKIPAHAWEKFRDFTNSGQTIEEYNVNKYNEFKVKSTEQDKPLVKVKPEIKAAMDGTKGRYTLNIDLILTLNGKRLEVG